MASPLMRGSERPCTCTYCISCNDENIYVDGPEDVEGYFHDEGIVVGDPPPEDYGDEEDSDYDSDFSDDDSSDIDDDDGYDDMFYALADERDRDCHMSGHKWMIRWTVEQEKRRFYRSANTIQSGMYPIWLVASDRMRIVYQTLLMINKVWAKMWDDIENGITDVSRRRFPKDGRIVS